MPSLSPSCRLIDISVNTVREPNDFSSNSHVSKTAIWFDQISPRRRAFAAPPDERTAGSTRHGNSLATGVPGWLNYYLPRSASGHVKLDAIPRAGEDRSVMNFTLPGTSTQWRNGAGVSLAGRSLRWKHRQSCARRANIGPPHQSERTSEHCTCPNHDEEEGSIRPMEIEGETKPPEQPERLSNAEIADRLPRPAQLLSAGKENPFKVKAYRRAAASIRTFAESLDQMVRDEADLTQFAGIGEGLAAAIREIVLTGTLGKLEKLRGQATPALAGLSAYPRLDPKRVMRIYKKLGITSVEELKANLENGAIEKALGLRLAQHVRQGVTETHAMLLYHADDLRDAIEAYLVGHCKARRARAAGGFRGRGAGD